MTIANVGNNIKQQELSFIAYGHTKPHRQVGRKFGHLLQNETYSFHMIHKLHALLLTQMI
jgi:hypothetical protein